MATLDLYFDDPSIAALYAGRSVCQQDYVPDLSQCPDSGFDLICLETVVLKTGEQAKFDFQLRGVMHQTMVGIDNVDQLVRVGYFLVPRSSMNDTPLIMQNSPGVIDSAYNGTIRMKVRSLADFTIEKGTCLGQLVLSSLRPFSVRIQEGRPPETHRGEGGFGSTGNTAAVGTTHVAV